MISRAPINPPVPLLLHSYDNLNRPTSIANYVSNIAYWPHGAIYSHMRQNGLGYGATYNSRLQPTEIVEAARANPNDAVGSVNSLLFAACLNWGLGAVSGPYGVCPSLATSAGNNGNLQGVVVSVPSDNTTPAAFVSLTGIQQSFGYDGVNRISWFKDYGSGSTQERDFGYDAYGNMWLTRNDASLPLSVNPPTPAMLTSAAANPYDTATNRLVSAQYDLAGNQTSVGNYSLVYDAENRQVASTDVNGLLTNYFYDGLGHRVQKTVSNSATTTYVYDASGGLAAEYSNGAPAAGSGCQTCYLSYDHLGSTRMVTDQLHNVVERHDYMPFGEEIIQGFSGRTGNAWGASTAAVNQKFTGKERDSESGLDYFGARYYGSALGRFTSPDWSPIQQPVPYANLRDPQTLNLYAYTRSNPLGRADVDGHHWWNKLGSLFTDAGCWCEGDVAVSSAAANRLSRARANSEWYARMTPRQAATFYAVAFAYAEVSLAVNDAASFASAEEEEAAAGGGRLTQDQEVDPAPPAANEGVNGYIGTNPRQAMQLDADIADARALGASDIRVNQQQVNADGVRVGTNRPDLQFTVNGKRYLVEYESEFPGRGSAHLARSEANDPSAQVIIKFIK